MSAILTENFRLFNLRNFISSVDVNSLYLFVSKVKPWDNLSLPPVPINNYRYYSDIYDDIVALKKLTSSNVCPVVKNNTWTNGTVYSMYRPDYNSGINLETIGVGNTSRRYPQKTASDGSTDLFYNCNFYVVNQNYQVYKCLYNGQSPTYPSGVPSTIQPSGNSISPIKTSDGYIWKYMYQIPTQYVLNFYNSDYIPVPYPGSGFPEETAVKNNAIDGAIEAVVVINAGQNYTNGTYTLTVDGDYTYNSGTAATISITVSGGKIISSDIVNRGSGYTFASVSIPSSFGPGTGASLEVVLSPKYGHGYSPYEELGAYRVMIESKISYSEDTQFPTDISYRQVGLLLNPTLFGTSTGSTQSSLIGTKSLKFTNVSPTNSNFISGEKIYQSQGSGTTAYGVAVSWNSSTKTLKYYQDQYDGTFQNNLIPFLGTSSITGISSGTIGSGVTNYLNQSINKNSGKILYIDNREAVNRSQNQTEDIKIVVEF